MHMYTLLHAHAHAHGRQSNPSVSDPVDLADWDEEKVKELVEAFLQVGGYGGGVGLGL
jgi:hypothetical protein